MSRHKWDNKKLSKQKPVATCIVCGVTKQMYFGSIFYFPKDFRSHEHNKIKDKAGNCTLTPSQTN